MLEEQCAAYYSRQAQHVSEKLAQRQAALPDSALAPELCVRSSFKVGRGVTSGVCARTGEAGVSSH